VLCTVQGYTLAQCTTNRSFYAVVALTSAQHLSQLWTTCNFS